MTTIYTYSEARQNLSTVLDEAEQKGEAIIVRRNGVEFIVKPIKQRRSPLDVPCIKANITVSEIVNIVREGRMRGDTSNEENNEMSPNPGA